MSDVRFERQDASPWTVAKFAIGLGAVTVAVGAVLIWFLVQARKREVASDPRRPPLYFSNEPRVPQGVRLQTAPFTDVRSLREREERELTTYGWVDQQEGVVRIPIDRAMDLYAQRVAAGAGAWPPADQANPPGQPTDAAPVPSPEPETVEREHGGERK